MLTFKEVKAIVAPFSGRAGGSPASDSVGTFAKTVMESLLYSGSQGGVRRVSIRACNGLLSLPPEVELPVKVKINGRATEVWGKWLTYSQVHEDCSNYPPADSVMSEEGETPLAYPLPSGGSVVGVMGVYDEVPDAHVLIQGKDSTGKAVYTWHNGEQLPGERLTIKKGQITHGQVVWGEITGVSKPKTNGYIQLWAVDPFTDYRQFLADWSPSEEKPRYRQFRLLSRGVDPIVKITMLCRMKLKDNYHDNELTLFDNSLAVLMAAQRVQGEYNNDVQVANYKKAATDDVLDREAGYKKVSGNPCVIFHELSGASIKNIV